MSAQTKRSGSGKHRAGTVVTVHTESTTAPSNAARASSAASTYQSNNNNHDEYHYVVNAGGKHGQRARADEAHKFLTVEQRAQRGHLVMKDASDLQKWMVEKEREAERQAMWEASGRPQTVDSVQASTVDTDNLSPEMRVLNHKIQKLPSGCSGSYLQQKNPGLYFEKQSKRGGDPEANHEQRHWDTISLTIDAPGPVFSLSDVSNVTPVIAKYQKQARNLGDLFILENFLRLTVDRPAKEGDPVPVKSNADDEMVKTILAILELLRLCDYHVNDILMVMAHCVDYTNRLLPNAAQTMSSNERAKVLAILCFISHVFLLDETCPLRIWHKYIFRHYCSLKTLNEAVMAALHILKWDMHAANYASNFEALKKLPGPRGSTGATKKKSAFRRTFPGLPSLRSQKS